MIMHVHVSCLLLSQQVIRIQALVRNAGYVYLIQKLNPKDTQTFGGDVDRLQKIMDKLTRAVCNLKSLLPEVDIEKAVNAMSIDIPEYFTVTTRVEMLKQFLMGLILHDVQQSIAEVTFDESFPLQMAVGR